MKTQKQLQDIVEHIVRRQEKNLRLLKDVVKDGNLAHVLGDLVEEYERICPKNTNIHKSYSKRYFKKDGNPAI